MMTSTWKQTLSVASIVKTYTDKVRPLYYKIWVQKYQHEKFDYASMHVFPKIITYMKYIVEIKNYVNLL